MGVSNLPDIRPMFLKNIPQKREKQQIKTHFFVPRLASYHLLCVQGVVFVPYSSAHYKKVDKTFGQLNGWSRNLPTQLSSTARCWILKTHNFLALQYDLFNQSYLYTD